MTPPSRAGGAGAPGPVADSAEGRALWDGHIAAMLAANDDPAIDKPAADPCATPLMEVARSLPAEAPVAAAARAVAFRRERCELFTRRTSFDLWAVVSQPETLFSDMRRIEPRFALEQLSGAPGAAAGNRYRLSLHDRAYLARLNSAIVALDRDFGNGLRAGGDPVAGPRRMDLRLLRAGPFGGETADLVVETLGNHRLAGTGSLWIVAHAEGGQALRVTLEACELFRWTWAAEWLADNRHAAPPGEDAHILNWPWCFERIADALDAEVPPDSRRSEVTVGPWPQIAAGPALREALRPHPALRELAARLDAGSR